VLKTEKAQAVKGSVARHYAESILYVKTEGRKIKENGIAGDGVSNLVGRNSFVERIMVRDSSECARMTEPLFLKKKGGWQGDYCGRVSEEEEANKEGSITCVCV